MSIIRRLKCMVPLHVSQILIEASDLKNSLNCLIRYLRNPNVTTARKRRKYQRESVTSVTDCYMRWHTLLPRLLSEQAGVGCGGAEVTVGTMSSAGMTTVRSNCAPSSVRSDRQYATACSNLPRRARGGGVARVGEAWIWDGSGTTGTVGCFGTVASKYWQHGTV